MSSLENKNIKDSYKDLLQVSNENNGIDDTLRIVSDGEGTESSLKLSSTNASFSGNVGIGTDDPVARLAIKGSNDTNLEIQPDIEDGVNRITNFNRISASYGKLRLDASEHQFYVSGSEKAMITSAGIFRANQIGIGGAVSDKVILAQSESPQNLALAVDGTVAFSKRDVDGGEVGLYFSPGGGADHPFLALYDKDANHGTKISSAENTFFNVQGGNVGIGTTNPYIKLEVHGNPTADGSKVSIVQRWVGEDSKCIFEVLKHSDTGLTEFRNNKYSDGVNGNYAFSDGSVGIGTTSPSGTLELSSTGTDTNFYMGGTPASGTREPWRIQAEGDYLSIGQAKSSFAKYLTFVGSKVGIGTTNPGAKLHIFDTNAGNGESLGLVLSNYDYGEGELNQSVAIEGRVRNGGGGDSPVAKFVFGKDSNFSDVDYRDGNLQFHVMQGVNGTSQYMERMRITSGGNVGINDTNPSKKLSVDGDAIITGNLTVTGTTITEDTETLLVQDKNIIMGNAVDFADTSIADDDTANGGGIVLKGATDKSILYDKGTESWNSNLPITIGGANDKVATESWVSNNAFSSLTDAQKAELKGDQGEAGADGADGVDGADGESTEFNYKGEFVLEEAHLYKKNDMVSVSHLGSSYVAKQDLTIEDGDSKYPNDPSLTDFWQLVGIGLQGADGAKGDSYFTQNGNDISYLDGNVGIGTDAPSANLEIKGGEEPFAIYDTSNEKKLRTYTDSNGTVLALTEANQDIIRLDGRNLSNANSFFNGGNVGIGTTNPSAPLHIKTTNTTDTLLLESTGDSNLNAPDLILYRNSETPADADNLGIIKFRGVNDGQVGVNRSDIDYALIQSEIVDVSNNAEKGSLSFWTRGVGSVVKRMTIDSDGNVGIGTTSPNARLEVFQDLDTSSGGSILKVTNTRLNTGSSSSVISLITDEVDGNTADERVQLAGSYDGNNGGKLDILTNNGTSLSTAMTIKADGNVGIGTTNPQELLTIRPSSGNADYTAILSSLGGSNENLYYTEWKAASGFKVHRATGTSGNLNIGIDTPDGEHFQGTGGNIAFNTNSDGTYATRMIIGKTGNVGIGTTNPTKILSVQEELDGGISLSGFSNNSSEINSTVGIDLQSNEGENNRTRARIISGADGANAGYLALRTRRYNNGTASIDEAMRITSDGNVGIGTTNPGMKLDVKGDIASGILSRIENDNTEDSKNTTLLVRNNSSANDSTILGLHNDSDYVLQVKNNGNVAIGHGLYNPTAKISTQVDSANGEYFLDVKGTSARQWGFYYDQASWESSTFRIDEFKADKTAHGRFTIANGGNVGIGDSNPSKKLSVAGDAIITGDLTVSGTTITEDTQTLLVQDKNIIMGSVESGTPNDDTANDGGIIVKASTDKSILFNKTTNKFDVNIGATFNGLTGIGTTNPGSSLHVAGGIGTSPVGDGVHMGVRATGGNRAIIQLNGEGGGYIDFSVSGTDWKGRILYDNQDNYMRFDTNGQQRMHIDSDGNVGIGTTSPDFSLEVQASKNDYGIHILGETVNVSTGSKSRGGLFNNADDELELYLKDSNAAAKIHLSPNKESYILGNVGIGTNNPTRHLSVDSGTTDTVAEFKSSGDANAYIVVKDSGSSGGAMFGAIGTDTIIGTGGSTERVRITSDGKVGIGTDDPDNRLSINGNAAAHAYEFYQNTTSSASECIHRPTTGEFAIRANSQERLRINSDGNVGIGTTNPNAKLDVNCSGGSLSVNDNGHLISKQNLDIQTAGGRFTGESEVGLLGEVMIEQANTGKKGGYIRFRTSHDDSTISEKMRITSSGNVGIGTGDPSANLHLNNSSGSTWMKMSSNVGTWSLGSASEGDPATKYFSIYDQDNNNHRLYIRENGNIGIGTTDPSHDLTLGSPTSTGTTTERLKIYRGSDDAGQNLEMGFNSITVTRDANRLDDPQSTFSIKQKGSDGTRTAMHIDTSGNVGIGTTTPGSKLQVHGDIAAVAGTVRLTNGGSPVGVGIYSPASNEMGISTNSNEAIRINSEGNVGIGTTSPTTALDINKEIGEASPIITLSRGGVAKSRFAIANATSAILAGSLTDDLCIRSEGGNIRFGTASATRTDMTIKSDGNVGIGTTDPDVNGLHVYSASGHGNGTVYIENTEATWGMGLKIKGGGNNDNDRYALKVQNCNGDDILFAQSRTGNVGIGTTSPSSKLDIETSGGSANSINTHMTLSRGTTNGAHLGTIRASASNDVSGLILGVDSQNILTIKDSGNVGIGTTTPSTYKLNVQGSVYALNGVTGSDDRIKHNEQPIKNALNTLSKITPKKYIKTAEMYEANHDFALNAENKPIDANGEKIEHTIEAGVIAQELKKIDELAFAVNDEQKDEDGNVIGPHAVNYNSLFTYAIAAINELNQKVGKLESDLVISKFKLAELEHNQRNNK